MKFICINKIYSLVSYAPEPFDQPSTFNPHENNRLRGNEIPDSVPYLADVLELIRVQHRPK